MIRDRRNIDQLFENGLKGFKEKSPDHSWDRLNSELNSMYNTKSMVYMRWVAASVLLFLAFGAGYFYADYKINNEIALASDDQGSNDPTKEINKPQQPVKIVIPESEIKSNSDVQKKNKKPNIKSAGFEKINLTTEIKNDKSLPVNSDPEITEFTKKETNQKDESFEKSTSLELAQAEKNPSHTSVEYVDKNKYSTKNADDIAKSQSNTLNPLYRDDNFILPKKDNNSLKWSVGAQIAPVISYRDISTTYSADQSLGQDTETDLNSVEEKLLAYSGGVDVNYNFSERWSVHSGLYFSRIGQKNSNSMEYQQVKSSEYVLEFISTSTGSISFNTDNIPDNIKTIRSTKDPSGSPGIENIIIVQNFDFFEIPLMLRYKVLDKRLGVSLSGGISPAYLLKNKNYLQINNEQYDLDNSDNLNSVIFNSAVALGIEFGISKKLAFNIDPTFKYALSPINNNSEFNYHPFYFSLFSGIRYKF